MAFVPALVNATTGVHSTFKEVDLWPLLVLLYILHNYSNDHKPVSDSEHMAADCMCGGGKMAVVNWVGIWNGWFAFY